MKDISLTVPDDVDAALSRLSAAQGRKKEDLIAEVLRSFAAREQSSRELADTESIRLYQELEAEDRELAEQGLNDYRRLLQKADRG
jgi:hypothetical protein